VLSYTAAVGQTFRVPSRIGGLLLGLVIALSVPAVVLGHAELDTSTPSAGSTVESPFDGPIVLTFTEPLGDDSEADLIGPDGDQAASAEVDAPDATMTFTLTAPLDPGDYEVRWTTVADDGHVERGTIEFTVTPAPPTPEPTPEPTPAPTATATAVASSPPPTPSPPPAATPSPTVDGGATGGSSDVLIPIIVALLIVGAGGAYLLTRRNRPIQP
jgi:methionine-rich copper-binding protein CopC